jgi:hypothetical protein
MSTGLGARPSCLKAEQRSAFGRSFSLPLSNRFPVAKPAMRLKKILALDILRGPSSLTFQQFQAIMV